MAKLFAYYLIQAKNSGYSVNFSFFEVLRAYSVKGGDIMQIL